MFWDQIKDKELDRQSGREIGRRELHKTHSFTLQRGSKMLKVSEETIMGPRPCFLLCK